MSHVRKVLGRLLENHLYVKPEKCKFHTTNTQFLGFIIRPGKVRMDPKKVQAVLDWQVPTSVKEVQRFIGFANFYRKFVRNFSSVVALLTALTKGSSTKFSWNSEAETAFLEFKRCFTSAPVLCIPDPNFPLLLRWMLRMLALDLFSPREERMTGCTHVQFCPIRSALLKELPRWVPGIGGC